MKSPFLRILILFGALALFSAFVTGYMSHDIRMTVGAGFTRDEQREIEANLGLASMWLLGTGIVTAIVSFAFAGILQAIERSTERLLEVQNAGARSETE